jgi:hypothetical protein
MRHHNHSLVAQGGEFGERRCLVGDRILAEFGRSKLVYRQCLGNPGKIAHYLALVECLRFDFPLLFQTVDNILVTPTDFMRQALFTNVRVPAAFM